MPDDRTLPYPENPGATHYDGCERTPGHHNCAIRLLDERRTLPPSDAALVDAAIRALATLLDAKDGEKSGFPVRWHGRVAFELTGITAALAERTGALATVTAERDALRRALVDMALPYEALLLEAESRRWIAPAVWGCIETSVHRARALLATPDTGELA